MGLCQSSACKILVVDANGQKETYYVSLKQLKGFRTMSDALRFVGIELEEQDRLLVQGHTGIEEIHPSDVFLMQTVVIRHGKDAFRYRITMDRLY